MRPRPSGHKGLAPVVCAPVDDGPRLLDLILCKLNNGFSLLLMGRVWFILLLLLAVSAAYLYLFPAPTLAYIVVVLLHTGLGVVASVLLARLLARRFRQFPWVYQAAWLLLAAGAAIGILLMFTGAKRPMWPVLYAHILLTLAALAFFAAGRFTRNYKLRAPAALAASLVAAAVIGAAAHYVRTTTWQNAFKIENPPMPPATMDGEGGGPSGPFFPSSATTNTKSGYIPADFFMESQACQRCHSDIYKQWNSSAHHFSSFNNQWYRKSIEYMQNVVGTRPSKWCGGCHDPALLYTGLMDRPATEIGDMPEAHAGLGCVMCHSIRHVKSTMGQGDYLLEYPALHDLAASKDPVIRWVHDWVTRLNPEPHRRAFLKPFMRQQPAEFCSTCHKVHLDVPVNAYRWVRGFDDYDNWQASGVSGQGARSFYYPPKPMTCVSCHMPTVASSDDGNQDGLVHSHRFTAANTALPFANKDQEQLNAVINFLKSDIVSVDVFAISPAEPHVVTGPGMTGELSTSFAVGEEAVFSVPVGAVPPKTPVSAPLDRVPATVRRGDSARVDVVVRTRSVGHFFPAGTVDAFDVWLELKAVDDKGRTIFWSGQVEDDGKGPVEPSAHFYRALLIDANGNPINKRNAWANRALVYVRLIPPGAADTVHFRLNVPRDSGDTIHLKAALHYRKFAWWNTQFSFRGEWQSDGPVEPGYDERSMLFHPGKDAPDLPIITLAEDEAIIRVLPAGAAEPESQVKLEPDDWQRWNDYGIGLLLQGDLQGAEAAFRRVSEVAPQRPDGWVNQGRVRVLEGDTAGARQVLDRALEVSPDLAAAHFFYAQALHKEGDYESAKQHLRKALEQYPRDRVVRNELGRIFFLQRRYQEAIQEFEKTLSVDPEDLQAHYNLMLCYNGLGDAKRAEEHKARYLRFKADESSQALTGRYRQQNPYDNNERQAIHEHESVPLDSNSRAAAD